MKVSTKGRYGLRLMLELALNENEEPMPLKKISQNQNISEKYLEQIINALSKAGIVRSYRGSHGGYTLAKPAEHISVGDVLRVMEGSLSPVECVEGGTFKCKRQDSCASYDVWMELKLAVDNVVNNKTIADLVQSHMMKNI